MKAFSTNFSFSTYKRPLEKVVQDHWAALNLKERAAWATRKSSYGRYTLFLFLSCYVLYFWNLIYGVWSSGPPLHTHLILMLFQNNKFNDISLFTIFLTYIEIAYCDQRTIKNVSIKIMCECDVSITTGRFSKLGIFFFFENK